MSDTGQPQLPEPIGQFSSVTVPETLRGKSGGITISSNAETQEQIKENFAGTKKPLDGAAEPSPEELEEQESERVSKAASELGKKGAEAAAAKRAEEAEEKEKAEAKEAKEAKEKPLGKPRDDPKARMLEATRKEAEAKREAKEARERADRAEALLRERESLDRQREELRRPAETKPAPEGKPTPSQFESYEAYLDAREEWNDKQRSTKTQAQQQEQIRNEWLRSISVKFKAEIDKATKEDPEFFEKIADNVKYATPDFLIPPGQPQKGENWIATQLSVAPENAPMLMLHFTEHPEEFKRISELTSPRAVTWEMAKLVARLEDSKEAKPKQEVSKAKPPVKPVTGSPHVPEDEDVSDDMSVEQHMRLMNKKAPWRMRKAR